ncbi:hypothetical protein [Methylophaga sp.]|uniref:hypothetical protein n=1 Tax=Methylophaga sp. TaxID=2024840 RepID=UPI00271F8880|nr:hypothetical protein [Methylophaga sp.]MDO8826736.1 hypothetical protein [Methylophaga sp.]
MECLVFIKPYAVIIGLFLDVFGVVLIAMGIWITINKANALEKIALPMLMDDLGSPENEQRNNFLSKKRAEERIKARNFTLCASLFFIIGFGFQIYGSWP